MKSVHHDTLLTLNPCCFSKPAGNRSIMPGVGLEGGVENWPSSNIWNAMWLTGVNHHVVMLVNQPMPIITLNPVLQSILEPLNFGPRVLPFGIENGYSWRLCFWSKWCSFSLCMWCQSALFLSAKSNNFGPKTSISNKSFVYHFRANGLPFCYHAGH